MTNLTINLQLLTRSFFSVSALYFIGIPIMLVANIVLARTLSVAEFGTFGFAISLATVLAIPVSGGLPMLLTREVATYSQKSDWSAYRGMVVMAHRLVASMSAIAGVGLLGWWLIAGDMFTQPIVIAFLLVPLLSLNGIRDGVLKGLGHPVLAAVIQLLLPVLMTLGYLVLAWLGVSTATNALWLYFTALASIIGLASLILWRVQPTGVRSTTSAMDDLPRWRRALLPFTIMSATTVLSTQIAVLLLGFTGQEEAVAQMRVAERGALLVAFPLAIINTIIGPYFVQALNSDDPKSLQAIVRQSARLTLAASLPLALILAFFGRSLIGWTFGAPYDSEAYLPMMILIGAQIVSVALGNGGMVLVMGGYERQTIYGLLLSLTLILVIGGCLIGTFGSTGAAIGLGAGIIGSKIYLYFAVHNRYAISSGIW